VTNDKMMFDRVSKKKATTCTPTGAQIELGVTKTVDPYTKKEVIVAPDGYDATKDDDAHLCADGTPTITLTIDNATDTATVVYGQGKYQLQSIEIRDSTGKLIDSRQVTNGGTWTGIPLSGAATGTITATITDTAYYTESDSGAYS
ncbi:hypothetical protein B7Z00_05275, partial [Candidatus Saccharibacteria bacterium 32-50-10]